HKDEDSAAGAAAVGAVFLNGAQDADDIFILECGDVLRRALDQKNIAHAQGSLAQLAADVFPVAVETEHLEAVAFTEAVTFKGATDQGRFRDEHDFHQPDILRLEGGIRKLYIGLDIDAGGVLDLE